MAKDSTIVSLRVLISVGLLILVALLPVVLPLLDPRIQFTASQSARGYFAYTLLVVCAVSGFTYLSERHGIWPGVDAAVASKLGSTLRCSALLVIALLDLAIWGALLSDSLLRARTLAPAALFHLMWIAALWWIRMSSETSWFISIAGGFLAAILFTFGVAVTTM